MLLYIHFAANQAPNDTFAQSSSAVLDQVINTCTFSGTTVTVASVHGLIVGERVKFTTTGTLPSPLSTATLYYVSTVLSTTTLNVATTQTGSSISFSGGSGTHSINQDRYISIAFEPGIKGSSATLNGPDPQEIWGIVGG